MRTAFFAFAVSLGSVAALACSDPPPAGDPSQPAGGTSSTGSGGSSTGAGGTTTGSGGTTTGSGGTTTGSGGTTTGSGGTTTGSGGSGGTTLTGPPFGHPDPNAQYPEYEGFTLWLVEEFEQPLDLENDPVWTWSDGGLDEGLVRFQKEGIKFEDGKMKLVVDYAEDSGATPVACSHAENKVPEKHPFPLVSGELRSRYNMFRYGRYEVRLKAPSVKPGDAVTNGNYISTLFTFRTPKFQDWREIDIEVTGDSPAAVTTNLIYANNQGAWSAEIAEDMAYDFPSVNTRTEFQDFAFEWLPDGITWYLNGEVVREKTSGGGLPIPELPVKIMMNLWIFDGSGFGGTEGANNEYPMQSEYEWFRFYKWDGEETYPCEGLSTTCLTAQDMDMASNNPCDGIDASGTLPSGDVCVATCQ